MKDMKETFRKMIEDDPIMYQLWMGIIQWGDVDD